MEFVRDRFGTGVAAGFAGGLYLVVVTTVLSKALGVVKVPFTAWSGVLMFGRRPVGMAETLMAMGGVLFMCVGLGVAYSWLVMRTPEWNYRVKGIFLGVGAWFASYAVAQMFRLASLTHIDSLTVFINLINSSIFGFILAEVTHLLDEKREKLEG